MTSRKKLFVHVGYPKTASSFLQQKVFPQLERTAFISHPFTQDNQALNKLQYADDALYDPAELQREIDRLFMMNPGKNLLLSDEHFCGLSFMNFINRGSIAQRLAKLDLELEILIFIRGQEAIIKSLYNQYLKMGMYDAPMDRPFISTPGRGMPYEDYESCAATWESKRRYIDQMSLMSTEHFKYSKLLDFYTPLFARTHVFLYEDLVADPQRVVTKLQAVFAEEFTLDPGDQGLGGRRNTGLADHRLTEKMYRNRMRGAADRLGERLVFGLARRYAKSRAKQFSREFERNLADIMAAADFAADNGRLATEYQLAVGQYPAHYPLV